MTPNQLQIFATIIKFKSFSKAASMLNQARPALSASVKLLENEFGGDLLIRDTGNVEPTILGAAVLAHTEVILREYDHLRQITGATSDTLIAGLRISAPSGLCCWPLPRILAAFRRSHPNVQVSILEAQTDNLSSSLANNLADIVLSTVPNPEWNWSALVQEPFVALFRATAMASSEVISICQLSSVPMIIADCDTNTHIESFFQQAGSILRKSHSASSYATVFSMVQEGLGVSLIPKSIARLAPNTLIGIPINDGPSRAVGLIHSTKSTIIVSEFAEEAKRSLLPD